MSTQTKPGEEEEKKNFAIGIDLGTTYSCVGVWRNNTVEIIANEQGNRTTPSYVGFTEKERIVGDGAKHQCATNPTNTVFDAKRLIGRAFEDKIVQEDMKLWPFKVINEGGKPMIQVTYKGDERKFLPEEISAMVLMKMKEIAESYLGQQVEQAVITVPAYFSDSQRQATKNAGQISGLQVLRIINEPTAAAIAYGMAKDTDSSEKKVLVFDLGGGTFDVSLLVIDDGIFEVKATAGDTHLGGEDFDSAIMNYVIDEFKKKHKVDPARNERSIRRLRSACERAKRTLSSSTTASIEVESFHEGLDLVTSLSRARFEDLCKNYFQSCIPPVEQVLKDAKIEKNEIDEVVLVGGSTRIPKVQQLIQEFFNGKEPNKRIDPDEAVAWGAAVQAALLIGEQSDEIDNMVLIDVAPLSLGVEAAGGMMSVIIPRNGSIPTEQKRMYSTNADNQTVVDVMIYEGERARTKDNNLLGKFELQGIPPAAAGIPRIEVTFSLDPNGILNVSAVEKSTGKTQAITINSNQMRLSKEDIDKMVHDAEKFKKEDQKHRDKIDFRNALTQKVADIRQAIESPELKIGVEDYKNIDKALVHASTWMSATPEADVKEYREQIKWLEEEIEPILVELFKGKKLAARNMGGAVRMLKRKETQLAIESGGMETRKRIKEN